VARRRFSHNAHDPWVDSREQLAQEFELANYLSGVGYPVARRIGSPSTWREPMCWSPSTSPTMGGDLDSHHLGQQLVRLHALSTSNLDRVESLRLVAQEGLPFEVLVPTRLVRWWRDCGCWCRRSPTCFPMRFSVTHLAQRRNVRRLLHLDVRRANLRWRRGTCPAFIDWSNAIVATPASSWPGSRRSPAARERPRS